MKRYLIALLLVLCTSFVVAQAHWSASGYGQMNPVAMAVLSGCSGSTCG